MKSIKKLAAAFVLPATMVLSGCGEEPVANPAENTRSFRPHERVKYGIDPNTGIWFSYDAGAGGYQGKSINPVDATPAVLELVDQRDLELLKQNGLEPVLDPQ